MCGIWVLETMVIASHPPSTPAMLRFPCDNVEYGGLIVPLYLVVGGIDCLLDLPVDIVLCFSKLPPLWIGAAPLPAPLLAW